MNNPELDFDIIKIIDDDVISAQRSKFLIEDFDIKTELITNGSFKSIEELLDRVLTGNDTRIGIICDHRLMHHNAFANFYGAEFVASLYKHEIPAILLTQYADADIDISIRKYRRWTPAMIPRDELNQQTLPNAFDFCIEELKGNVPVSRKPHRTLVEILSCSEEGGERLAEAIIPGWNNEHMVRFPLSIMPEEVMYRTLDLAQKRQLAYVFAEINIGAIHSSELYFDSFEWASDSQDSALDHLLK